MKRFDKKIEEIAKEEKEEMERELFEFKEKEGEKRLFGELRELVLRSE
jgi:hypothetical protein